MSTIEIEKYLKDHKVYADVEENGDEISVTIEMGDWKHDHLYCRDLMQELGYTQVGEEPFDEDTPDDCYSSTHYFRKLN